MTDRELLELAAKAAGIVLMNDEKTEKPWYDDFLGFFSIDDDDYWNPLDEDGQALRLAVKLRMDVETSLVHCGAICADVWDDGIEEYRSTQEPEGADPLAATRRAIVLAAAALAK